MLPPHSGQRQFKIADISLAVDSRPSELCDCISHLVDTEQIMHVCARDGDRISSRPQTVLCAFCVPTRRECVSSAKPNCCACPVCLIIHLLQMGYQDIKSEYGRNCQPVGSGRLATRSWLRSLRLADCGKSGAYGMYSLLEFGMLSLGARRKLNKWQRSQYGSKPCKPLMTKRTSN